MFDWITPETAYGAAGVLAVCLLALGKAYNDERKRSDKKDERYHELRDAVKDGFGAIREVMAALKESVR